MIEALRTARGLLQSMRIYYSGRPRAAAMDTFYRQFIGPGDLAFDIGAHVGDRTACFRRLGAQVVALEPQPALARSLRLLFSFDRKVTVEEAAIAREPGRVALMVNVDNPTISTASRDFIDAAANAEGWREQRWTRSITVATTTLDALIGKHGAPAFIKIDVEGFEAEALAGLSQPVAALSFEFTIIQRDIARSAIARCSAMGYARFNAVLGESLAFAHQEWISPAEAEQWLNELPREANSGDIYVRLR